MRFTLRTIVAGLAVVLPAQAVFAGDTNVDCYVQHYTGNPTGIAELNSQCKEWNDALGDGNTPWMGPTAPKPAGAAQLHARVRTLNACIAGLVHRKVPKPDAVVQCADGLN